MPKAFIFASSEGNKKCYLEALRRLRWNGDIVVIRSTNDIDISNDPGLAVVEIFDPQKANVGVAHPVRDTLRGIEYLLALRDRQPNCAVVAISHNTCVSGCNYVEQKLLASYAVAIDWAEATNVRPTPTDLVTIGLRRAREHHSSIVQMREERFGKPAGEVNAVPSQQQPAAV